MCFYLCHKIFGNSVVLRDVDEIERRACAGQRNARARKGCSTCLHALERGLPVPVTVVLKILRFFREQIMTITRDVDYGRAKLSTP